MDSLPLSFARLDREVRAAMLDELAADVRTDAACASPLLNRAGRARIVELLTVAFGGHDERWLAEQMVRQALVGPTTNAPESVAEETGRVARSLVPVVARALSQQLFNRYYARGVCRMALALGQRTVEVYRADRAPGVSGEHVASRAFPAASLIADLRGDRSVDEALGLSAGGEERFTVRLARHRQEAPTWRPARATGSR